ncbi:MAG: hypothetical protein RIF32_19155 [Leptospirales bacterium]|jgi:hypothetical protein
MNQRMTTIRILHLALLIPPIALMGVFYFLRQSQGAGGEAPVALLYAAIAAALAGPVASHVVSRQLFSAAAARIKENLAINEEQTALSYQTAKIVQWALLEGPAMFQAVVFYLIGEPVLLGLGGLLLALLGIQGPSLADLQKRLEISSTRWRQIQAASG